MSAGQQISQLIIRKMARDAVCAQEKCAAVFNFDHLHVGFDGNLSAESAADYVLARMISGLLRRHTAGANFFFHNRMIFSFAVQFSVRTQPIKSRVADMSNRRAVTIEMQRDHCRGHHREARIVHRHLVNRTVRALNRQLH